MPRIRTRDTITGPSRTVIVRPTRDGDHILVTVSFGKYKTKKFSIFDNLHWLQSGCYYQFRTELFVVSVFSWSSIFIQFSVFRYISSFWNSKKFLFESETPARSNATRRVRFAPDFTGWLYFKPCRVFEVSSWFPKSLLPFY